MSIRVICSVFAILFAVMSTPSFAVQPPAGFGKITHARGAPRPATCNQFAGAPVVYQGLFKGVRLEGDIIRRVGGKFCFASQAECASWIYDMRSMNRGAIRAATCTRL